MSCEIAGIKLPNGVLIDGFYEDKTANFQVGANYYCGSGAEEGKIVVTPSNLFIGVAVSKTRIKLDIGIYDKYFYTQNSTEYFDASVESIDNTQIWYLNIPTNKEDTVIQFNKGDKITFIAPVNSVDNQQISIIVNHRPIMYKLLKKYSFSEDKTNIIKNEITQNTFITAYFSSEKTDTGFIVDIHSKGNYLKQYGGIIAGDLKASSFQLSDKISLTGNNGLNIKNINNNNYLSINNTLTNTTITHANNSINVNNIKITNVADPVDQYDAITRKFLTKQQESEKTTIGCIKSFLNTQKITDEIVKTTGWCPLDGRELHLSDFPDFQQALKKKLVPSVTIEQYNNIINQDENLYKICGKFGVDEQANLLKVPLLPSGCTLQCVAQNVQSINHYFKDTSQRVVGYGVTKTHWTNWTNSSMKYYSNPDLIDFVKEYKMAQGVSNIGFIGSRDPSNGYVLTGFDNMRSCEEYMQSNPLRARVGRRNISAGIYVMYRVYIGPGINN